MRVSNFLNYYYHPHSSSVANKLFFTLLFLILLTFLPLFFVSCSDIVALGTKIPVLVKPPYKVVANVIITAQPEKFIYTYGDTLDLTGLEVAIFYDYGDPAEIIKLADFEQYNITTSPAVGDILTFVDNNSQPIEITCKQVPAAAAADPELEDKSAKTWNLTVYKADQEVVWPVGLSGTIKQQLFEIDLSAHTNNGNGSFQWAEPGDRTYTSEAAMVGIFDHRMTFIPNDHGNYESYTVRVNVRVTSGVEMARVEAGTFTMGNDSGEYSSPEHEVTLTKAFKIGKYPITQEEYIAVMGKSPSPDAHPSFSIHNLTWFDAAIFCNRLSEADGLTPAYSLNGTTDTKTWGFVPDLGTAHFPDWDVICDWTANGYRLPTEAQWEYAAQGDYLAWIEDEDEYGEGFLGIYEWCWDWINPGNANNYPNELQTDPLGPNRGNTGGYQWNDAKIYRGENFYTRYWAFNSPLDPSALYNIGLRVVRNAN